MAEGMLKNFLPNRNIYSAGIGALIGRPADPSSIRLMAEAGIDISEHRAQQISLEFVRRADLILVMDTEQKNVVETKYSGARGKVFRLCEFLKKDVPDPYRQDFEQFRQAYRLINEGTQFWAEQIKRMD
jgi:protein-tyrosine phosphatase